METLRLVIVTALCAGGAAAALAADPYPNKPIVLTVAYAPGGGSDNTAPAIAEAAPPLLSQPTMVINKPDASGSIGWSHVTNARPYGYKVVR